MLDASCFLIIAICISLASKYLSQINSYLQWAHLVLGWVTVYEQVNHLGTEPAN